MRRCLFLLSLLCACLPALADTVDYRVYGLTCERLENPVGLDVEVPVFGWKLQSGKRGTVQSAYQVLVATDEAALNETQADIWDSGKTPSGNSVNVPFGGEALQSSTTYYWKVRSWNGADEASAWSLTASFTTGILQPQDWGGAKWIAMEADKQITVPAVHAPLVNEAGEALEVTYRLPQFRKVFTVHENVKQALLYVTGLGQFDCYLNGVKAGDHFLDPGWTKYDKEALYEAFDVTEGLKSGDNVLGVMLGNGFYNVPKERYYKLVGSFGAPKMRLKLIVRYTDGTEESVASDASWHVTDSPVTFSSIYGGEDYDARLEQPGWRESAAFDDSRWQQAVEVAQDIALKAQVGNSLRVRRHVPAVMRFQNGQGEWIYDLGQNFSGIIRVRLKGESGQSVIFRPAELLHPDQSVNQNATGTPYYFKYTLKDGQEACWQPQFSYYGFRYVQVEGAVPQGEANPEQLPVIVDLEGLHTSNEAPQAGRFHCSKPMFNSIYNLIDWAVSSNMASVTTDCPHREKLGWQEQNHLMQYAMQYRYDMLPLYRKIMDDLAASQREDGAIPSIAPEYVRFADGFEDSPEWGSSFIISAWYLYLWYGDLRPVAKHYKAMKRYLDYLTVRAENHIVDYGLGDWFDIGPKAPGYAQLTAKGLTATAMYYYDTVLLGKMAALLGEREDEARFTALAADIKQAYNDTFFHADNCTYDRNSQTASALSLYLDLAAPQNREKVLQNLVDDIQGRGPALTAGDIGYRYVLCALEAGGRSDLIYDMNSKYDVPGYGWQLAHGATALTESWQAYDNVSNNHLMLGHFMEWLFGGVGGIKQEDGSTAFHDILINPQTVGDLTGAETSYESPYGRIRSEWRKTKERYTLLVEVPANCRATVCLPAFDIERIREYGVPVSQLEGITYCGQTESGTKWSVGSGTYLFEVKL